MTILQEYIMLTSSIRNRIKSVRKEKNEKGTIFSIQLGMSAGYISHIENGVIKKIERKHLEMIFSKLLNITGDELKQYVDEVISESLNMNYLKKRYYNIRNAKERCNEIIASINALFQESLKMEDNQYIYQRLMSVHENLETDIWLMYLVLDMPFYELAKIESENQMDFLSDLEQLIYNYTKK